jgi:hypothetical protein
MPRFFFHTADGSRIRDTQGIELADETVARREAVRVAGALLNDDPDLIWDGRDFRVEVTDESGRLVLTVVTLALDSAVVD